MTVDQPDHQPGHGPAAPSAPQPTAEVRARAVVLEARQVGGRDRDGRVLHALDLTVLPDGRPPRRARVSVPVPDAALALVYPGAELPARLVGDDDAAVTVLELDRLVDAHATTAHPASTTAVEPTPGREPR